jgi:hypothetical protein
MYLVLLRQHWTAVHAGFITTLPYIVPPIGPLYLPYSSCSPASFNLAFQFASKGCPTEAANSDLIASAYGSR